jgi:FecR protein
MNMNRDEPEREENAYLWDGSGDPDPEVEKLEALLSPSRYDIAARPTPRFEVEGARKRRMRFLPAFASLAAVGALAVVLAVMLSHRGRQAPQLRAGWEISNVRGTLQVGKTTVSGSQSMRPLEVGEVLETGVQSEARISTEHTGQIDVEAKSRLRLVANGNNAKRIALDRGTIHAFIWSPPGEFVVDTPSGTSVDLGCAYTLHIDDSGAGLVRTSLGWVGFKSRGRESFIPAGAAAGIRPSSGPGTPYFEDASLEFRSTLARFDFEDSTAEQGAHDLRTIVHEARKRDALTLWHLLARSDAAQRVLVYAKLAKFVPPPPGVTEEGILRLDRSMMDRWWNELGFDDIAVWRRWERTWNGTEDHAK